MDNWMISSIETFFNGELIADVTGRLIMLIFVLFVDSDCIEWCNVLASELECPLSTSNQLFLEFLEHLNELGRSRCDSSDDRKEKKSSYYCSKSVKVLHLIEF